MPSSINNFSICRRSVFQGFTVVSEVCSVENSTLYNWLNGKGIDRFKDWDGVAGQGFQVCAYVAHGARLTQAELCTNCVRIKFFQ